jgi:hypothetical protein
LKGAGYDAQLDYSTAEGGLVFCRRQSQSNGAGSYLWVRLAADAASDGEAAPHLDLDLCNFAGSGVYGVPHDAELGLECDQGLTWDLYWHDGPGITFLSQPTSPACVATVTADGGGLVGTFACQGLTPFQGAGSGTLDVSEGSFRCAQIE